MLKRPAFSIIFVVLALMLLAGILLYGYSKPAILEFAQNNNNLPLILNKQSTNILVLGIPGNGYDGAYLSDTIFVINLNPNNKTITLISIPRDLWVKIPNNNSYSKINALYALSNPKAKSINEATNFNLIKTKVSEITGLNIDYTFVFDLKGFGNLIDQMGGINVWLDKTVLDPRFQDPYDPNDIFDLPPGWHTLDGKTAIKFVRTRFAPEGDFYRINNQHLIIGALKDKFLELTKVWSIMDWLKLWQSLKSHYVTDIDFSLLLNISNNFKTATIKYLTISNRQPDNLLISTMIDGYFNNATTSVYILMPKAGLDNYDEIHNYLHSVLNN